MLCFFLHLGKSGGRHASRVNLANHLGRMGFPMSDFSLCKEIRGVLSCCVVCVLLGVSLLSAAAQATVVMEEGGKTSAIDDARDPASSERPWFNKDEGGDIHFGTPSRKKEEPEPLPPLPYGIVPDVKVPWLPPQLQDKLPMPPPGPAVPLPAPAPAVP